MKLIHILLISIFVLISEVSLAQKNEDRTFVYNRFTNSESIVNDFSKFRYKNICSDTVLVTQIGKRNRSKDLTNQELKKWMFKNYFNRELEFALDGILNDGYVIIIAQYRKTNNIPVRFFTLFLSHDTGKIVVIEIEENQ